MSSSKSLESNPPSQDDEDTERTSICDESSDHLRAPPAPHDPLVGERIGPYQVLERIGSGGMATVYLARDERQAGIHQYVAIKRVHGHLASDPHFVAMFIDEARIASLLRHPNVCRVMDYGHAAGARYLVMEHLCGVSLSTVRRVIAKHIQLRQARPALPIARRRDDVRRAALVARMIEDACEGLHAVHELRRAGGEPLNVVHRDISPENLMLTCHGVVKLVDFGIVKTDFQRHTTQEGIVKGKLAYLPPEALQGLALDRRADVWGIGVTAWELLTGRRLFRRESDAQTLLAVAKVDVAPPSSVSPTLSPLYDEPIMRALAAEPDDRYPDARTFGRAMREVSKRLGRGADAGDLEEWLRDEVGHGASCRELWAVETTKQHGMRGATEPPPPPPPPPSEPRSVSTAPAGHAARARKSRRGLMLGLALALPGAVGGAAIAWGTESPSAHAPRTLARQPSGARLEAEPPRAAGSASGDLLLEVWDAERKTLLWRAPVAVDSSSSPRDGGAAPRAREVWPPIKR